MSFIILIIMFYYCIFYMPWDIANNKAREEAKRYGLETYSDPSGIRRVTATGKKEEYDISKSCVYDKNSLYHYDYNGYKCEYWQNSIKERNKRRAELGMPLISEDFYNPVYDLRKRR